MKNYLVHRYCFELPVKGFYQELILLISTCSSILILFNFAMLGFRKRIHIPIVALSFLSSILLLSDLVYYRFFNDFITIPVLFLADNMSVVWGSLFTLLRPSDLLLFLDTFILVIMMNRKSIQRTAWSFRHLTATIMLAILLLYLNFVMVEKGHPELLVRTFDRQIVVKSIGAYNYHLYDIITSAKSGLKKAAATNDDLLTVESFLKQLPKEEYNKKLFGAAKGYNVFLVSMESLQSFVIGRRIDGQEVTPYLNRLIKESYYFDNFYHQTGQGKTSDAEFTIDTSLFPLPSGAVYFSHAQNAYDSTPNILKKIGYYPIAFHANNRSFWNRGNMYKTMGYERFFSSSDYKITEDNTIGWGLNDISFFKQSIEKLKELPQPFYSKFITLTNHYPFDLDEKDQLIPKYVSNSSTLNRYIPNVRYMDEALKVFFEEVKKAGLYERSIFILYGDHYGISHKHKKAMAQLLGKEKLNWYDHAQLQRVPLIIHIPGQKGKQMDTISGQIDLKPTLLHLLGIRTAGQPNFGQDLFAMNRRELAILRDGSFITDRILFTKNRCYDKTSGEVTDKAECEPFKKDVANRLAYSDHIVYGDLLRFTNQAKKL
ncbi:LTA synthase family protein [Cohnella sp.]|uniref:LTA synthase family protein n=1 Tax=Cohnella sp. TaxID=1883426 RepID=UPI003563F408